MLSKILGNLIRRSVPEPEVVNINNLPKYAQAKLAMERLIPLQGKSLNLKGASRVEIQCISPNILELTARIDYYREKVLRGELSSSDCFTEFKSTSLDAFFTDEDGMYIPTSAIKEFITTCIDFFIVIEATVDTNARHADFSLRLLSKCFTSIQNVCTKFEAQLAH